MILYWLLISMSFIFLFCKLIDFNENKIVTYYNYVFPSLKSAQNLFNKMILFRIEKFNKSSDILLPHYKYFTEIINFLIKSAQDHGSAIHSIIPELKSAIAKDMAIEKKIKASFYGGIYQMFFVSFIGILLVFQIKLQVKINYKNYDLLMVFLFQFLGIILFIFLFIRLKHYHFSIWEKYIKISYKLRSLSFAGLPISTIYKKLKIDSIPYNKSFAPFKERIEIILKAIKTVGASDINDYEILVSELWQSADFRFEEFLKHLAGIKLFIIIFFFLGSYLYLLFLLID